jgi:MFS family permease
MTATTDIEFASEQRVSKKDMRRAIIGACLGTAFEWYDFFLYAILAVFFSAQFFPKGNETAGLLASLATFGAGFVVRPLGAILFGRLGDRIGRKHTFLLTIILMGLTTAGVGFVPTYATIGWAAPALLVALRLIQGLSLGGEYGGAATYVAEFAPDKERGHWTAWIQTTVSFGQIMGLLAVFASRSVMSPADFSAWGWRLPFFFSLLLLAVSVYIRLKLDESPAFQELKKRRASSSAPLSEAFGGSKYLKLILLGIVVSAGQGVIGYSGQVYIISYLIAVMKINPMTVNLLVGASVLAGVPMLIFFGRLSDRIGRKWILLVGCLIAAATYFPIYKAITHYANPALEQFQQNIKVTVAANDCNFHLFVTPNTKLSECDRIRGFLAHDAISYTLVPATGPKPVITLGDRKLEGFEPGKLKDTLKALGYPAHADPKQMNTPMVLLLMILLTLYASMLYAPLAAFLVEQFPTRIRYTSVSVSYNFGTGWFGGMAPFVISAIAVQSGNIYDGFWYPVVVALIVFVIGALFVENKKNIKLRDIGNE